MEDKKNIFTCNLMMVTISISIVIITTIYLAFPIKSRGRGSDTPWCGSAYSTNVLKLNFNFRIIYIISFFPSVSNYFLFIQ